MAWSHNTERLRLYYQSGKSIWRCCAYKKRIGIGSCCLEEGKDWVGGSTCANEQCPKIWCDEVLAKKPMESLDDNILYVSKKNVELWNSIIKEGHKESTRLLKGLTNLINTMQKDLKCIDIQLMKEDAQTIEVATNMVKIFQERIQFIRETKSLTTNDFSKVARIESMLTVCFDHLEVHKEKVS